jgi:subtilase family serine protease
MTGFRLGRAGRVTAASCALALVGVATFAGEVSASGPGRQVLAGTRPAWTAAAKQATAVAPAQPGVQARVWLAPRDAAGLTALAQAVTDPSSPQYEQFLSEPDYRARYAPTADQLTAVESWLTSAGLAVGSVGPDNHYVAVAGSADAVNAAFGTQLTRYVVSGKPELAPATDLSVPDSVAGLVEAVTGLSTLGHQMTPGDMGAPDAFVVGEPCSSFYGQ